MLKGARRSFHCDTRIPSSNKGFWMLMKLGWVEGQGLGVNDNGEFLNVSSEVTGILIVEFLDVLTPSCSM